MVILRGVRRRCQSRQLRFACGVAAVALLPTCAAQVGQQEIPSVRVAEVFPEASGPTGEAIALVVTQDGLAGIPVGTTTPRWTDVGAVAAPDGSAVFALQNTRNAEGSGVELVQIDPRNGSESSVGAFAAPSGTRVAAVAPGGGRIALVTENVGTTTVIDFDVSLGRVRTTRTFEGVIDPEAFSLDGTRIFAARSYGDYYNVQVLDLTTGAQHPTLGPDKSKPPENMYGSVVQAALSDDGSQLATLYRDSTKPGRTAFVHLLFLESGATFCIDLHDPFGTGGAGADAIEWRDGLIVVGHRSSGGVDSTTATIDPAAVLASPPQEHYPAETSVDASAPSVPVGIASAPGFERFIALARVAAESQRG